MNQRTFLTSSTALYRADKNRGGNSGKLGLSLSICKALVEAQGGTIAAESGGRGTGTSMIVSFKA